MVAFDGMGSLVVTFQAAQVTAGYVAGLSGANTVSDAGAGATPVGVILNQRNGCAAVQIRGYVQVKCGGSTLPGLGWGQLVADGSGGLREATTGETGRTCLVVNRDTENKTVGLFL